MCMYGYSYDRSPLAAERPMTKEEIIKLYKGTPKYNHYKIQVYELIPVTVTPPDTDWTFTKGSD